MSFEYDLGFLGGGQLARMSIQAAQQMGLKCLSLDPGQITPASQIASSLQGKLEDPESVAELIQSARHITLENEFIPADTIAQALEIASREPNCLLPGVETLRTVQDKLLQRKAYDKFGAPSPKAFELDPTNPQSSYEQIGFPCVLKARYGGYDGKGTRYAKSESEFNEHKPLWENGNWMVEQFVPFKREVAVMVCRSKTQTVCFPTMETIQTNHVCDLVFPANTDASQAAIAAVESVEGYGLFGVELFELEDGTYLINEIAPRPHNSGHYSLDWGGLSQFQAHVRLCLNIPIPELSGQPTCMANLLGQPDSRNFETALVQTLQDHPKANFHWYGKSESRPGRKMGHLNTVGDDAKQRAINARSDFYRHWAQ